MQLSANEVEFQLQEQRRKVRVGRRWIIGYAIWMCLYIVRLIIDGQPVTQGGEDFLASEVALGAGMIGLPFVVFWFWSARQPLAGSACALAFFILVNGYDLLFMPEEFLRGSLLKTLFFAGMVYTVVNAYRLNKTVANLNALTSEPTVS